MLDPLIIKMQTEACSVIKKETLVQLFSCEFCEIFKNTFFHKTPPVAASVNLIVIKLYNNNYTESSRSQITV